MISQMCVHLQIDFPSKKIRRVCIEENNGILGSQYKGGVSNDPAFLTHAKAHTKLM